MFASYRVFIAIFSTIACFSYCKGSIRCQFSPQKWHFRSHDYITNTCDK